MKKIFRTVALMVATAGMLLNVSCKKNEAAALINEASAVQKEQSVSPAEQKVTAFLEAYSSMKRGAKAEGDPVTPEEARWQWETTLNYCYGFTQDQLSDMRVDTVWVSMPQADAQGNIAYADLLSTYGEVVSAVREAYKSIDMEGKTLQFVMMSLADGMERADGDRVCVVMSTGSRTNDNGSGTPVAYHWYGRPFHAGDDWIWGLNLGKCDGSVHESDAAKQLTIKVGDYDMNHSLLYTPCPTCYTYIENPHITQFYTGCNGEYDSVFYATGLTPEEVRTYCIPSQDLNKYYAWIMLRTHYPDMVINPYGYDWYYQVLVTDGISIRQDKLWKIWHEVYVYNCTRWWRKLNPNYPVPIEEEE